MSTVRERIRFAMKLRDYKQNDLAEKTGISKGALSSYLSGRYVPKQNTLYMMAKALDVNEIWLIMGEESAVQDEASAKAEEKLISFYRKLSKPNKERCLNYLTKLLELQQEEAEVKLTD